jgi:hypothetical protein
MASIAVAYIPSNIGVLVVLPYEFHVTPAEIFPDRTRRYTTNAAQAREKRQDKKEGGTFVTFTLGIDKLTDCFTSDISLENSDSG